MPDRRVESRPHRVISMVEQLRWCPGKDYPSGTKKTLKTLGSTLTKDTFV
jgi:hypothetical protein